MNNQTPSTLPTPNQAALKDFHRGMSLGYLAKPGYYASSKSREDVLRMKELGVRWIALHMSVIQEAFYSTDIRRDPEWTSGDEELRGFITFCHENGMYIMFKPMINLLDSVWQGRISFPDGGQQIQGRQRDYWKAWFASFQAILSHYAGLCEETGVELFCAGCELVGTVHREQQWRETIRQIRSLYKGTVTFDTDHSILAKKIEWFEDLDMLSVSFYCSGASTPGTTVEQMAAHLEPKRKELRELAGHLGKPIVFGESGCRSRLGAAIAPNDYQLEGEYSGEEQANYLDAVCRVFSEEPWWRGLYWWKWDENQTRPHFQTDPRGDMGFTLEGKPAAGVLKKWYGKKR